jgi:hypothetical protein
MAFQENKSMIIVVHLGRRFGETSEKLRDKLNEKWSANHRFHLAPSVPAETADSTSNEYDNEEDPSSQLLTEYWTSFSANN